MKTQATNSTSNMRPKLSPVPLTAATNVPDLTDPFVLGLVAMPADRLGGRLSQVIRESPAVLLGHPLLVELMKKIDIPTFAAIDARIDVVDVHPLGDEVYVCFDFFLREAPTEMCRKGRKLDGEAAMIFKPGEKTFVHVNFAQVDRNDIYATATAPLPINPA